MSIPLNEITPYLNQVAHYDAQLRVALKAFFEQSLGQNNFYVAGPADYSSCFCCTLGFNCEWQLLPNESPDSQFELCVYISLRGPFISSTGLELQPYQNSDYRLPGDTSGMYRPTPIAQQKARHYADAVAQQFGRTYLDRDWAESQIIDPDSLSGEVLSVIFPDDMPTIFKVLFGQFI